MSNYDTALERAIDRDTDDLERLEHCKTVLLTALDALAPGFGSPLGHPDARWHPDDLHDALSGELRNIEAEMAHYTGPIVLADEDA